MEKVINMDRRPMKVHTYRYEIMTTMLLKVLKKYVAAIGKAIVAV